MSLTDSPADRFPEPDACALSLLRAVLLEAGAVLAPHHGSTVALSYGSAAGELAACVSGVGIASRSEMTKLELRAPRHNLERVLEALLDRPLLPRGIVMSGAGGWFRIDEGRLVALCDREHGERLRGRLEFWTMRDSALTLHDRTDEWGAIAVVGRRAEEVLRDLGVYGPGGDPRSVPPITRAADDPGTAWLLCGEDYALALMPAASAPASWRRITASGRRWRICAVGHDALLRYRVLERPGSRR
jgi:glycine cleavage system aminomethyltransferase T